VLLQEVVKLWYLLEEITEDEEASFLGPIGPWGYVPGMSCYNDTWVYWLWPWGNVGVEALDKRLGNSVQETEAV